MRKRLTCGWRGLFQTRVVGERRQCESTTVLEVMASGPGVWYGQSSWGQWEARTADWTFGTVVYCTVTWILGTFSGRKSLLKRSCSGSVTVTRGWWVQVGTALRGTLEVLLMVKLYVFSNAEILTPGFIVNTCIYAEWHIHGCSFSVIYNSERLKASSHFIGRDWVNYDTCVG